MPGLFLSFEGIDGVGKSTQVTKLQEALISQFHQSVVVTREPGGTQLGMQLRTLLLGLGEDAGEEEAISPRTEALLFAADRAQHVAQVIQPALSRGDVVICDRYIDSSLAYQAGGRQLTVDEIYNLSMWATDGLLPARTYVLDMDPKQAFARLNREYDRMEQAGFEFAMRTREAFLQLAEQYPSRIKVLDATQPVEVLSTTILNDVLTLLRSTAQA